LGLRTLHSRRRHLDALFFINVFNNTIDCKSILDTVSLRVPSKLIRDFSIFSVSKALRSSPSARCSTVANKVDQLMDIFSTKTMQIFWTFKIMFPSMTISPHEKLFRLFLYSIFISRSSSCNSSNSSSNSSSNNAVIFADAV
jgi:hypothetical protein